jgi:hypothetical protein
VARTDLDDGDAAGQLGEALLELLAIPVGVGVLDLTLDLGDPAVDVVVRAAALDDGGVVLGDHDLAGRAQEIERGVLELEADGLGDDLTTGEDGHVGQHRLAALAEAGCLHGHRVEGATDLVDHEGGEGLALDVLGDDQERLAGLHDLLEHRHQVGDGGDLALGEQDERVLEDGFLALGVRHEVRRQVALVELHALGELEVDAEGVRLLDGDHTVLADLVDGVGEDLADGLVVVGRDGGDLGDLAAVVDLLGLLLDGLHGGGDGLVDAALEGHGVGAGGHVAEALADQRLRQHGGGGGAVTGDVVGLGGDLLDQLGPHVLVGVLQLDLPGDGHAVVGDRGGAELLLQHHVAARGPSVTLTVSASLFTPASRPRRASSSNFRILDMGSSAHFSTMASTSRAFRISTS